LAPILLETQPNLFTPPEDYRNHSKLALSEEAVVRLKDHQGKVVAEFLAHLELNVPAK